MIGKHIANPKTHSSFKVLNDYITGKAKRRLEEAGEKIAFTGCPLCQNRCRVAVS
jgi:hypothetical protein